MRLDCFRGKRVFVTGHTGFKGAWLSEWLLALGAEVTGYALPPPTIPSLFDQLDLERRLHHVLGDVRDSAALNQAVRRAHPDFLFHLAAQSLVRPSYTSPTETFSTNIIGTANVLEAVRLAGEPVDVVVATTDKCYANDDQTRAFSEDDPLGGRDPYSASKAAAEIVAAAYRHSYFNERSAISLATVRAGNVVGGGDWASERLVPDCVRSLQTSQPIVVRNPGAVRPWQHVLECLSGYLVLGAELHSARATGDHLRRNALCSSFNFGPSPDSERPVLAVVEGMLKSWPGRWTDGSDPTQPHEAVRLQLSIQKAERLLRWRPAWSFDETIAHTVAWYRNTEPGKAAGMTLHQIGEYVSTARASGIEWAQ